MKHPKGRTKCAHCGRKCEPQYITRRNEYWQCVSAVLCDLYIDQALAKAFAALVLSKADDQTQQERNDLFMGYNRPKDYDY